MRAGDDKPEEGGRLWGDASGTASKAAKHKGGGWDGEPSKRGRRDVHTTAPHCTLPHGFVHGSGGFAQEPTGALGYPASALADSEPLSASVWWRRWIISSADDAACIVRMAMSHSLREALLVAAIVGLTPVRRERRPCLCLSS